MLKPNLFDEYAKYMTTISIDIELSGANNKNVKRNFDTSNPKQFVQGNNQKKKVFQPVVVKKSGFNSDLTKKNQETLEKISLPCKRPEENKCPCCEWIFPEDYEEHDMNGHVNDCIEGKGFESMNEYRRNLKKIKRDKKQKEKEHKKCKNFDSSKMEIDLMHINNLHIPEEISPEKSEKCEFCELSLDHLDPTFKQIHLCNCKKEQHEFLQNIRTNSISYHIHEKVYKSLRDISLMKMLLK